MATMRISTKAMLGGGTLTLVAAAFAAYLVLRPVELPEASGGDRREVFPELDLKAAAPGTSIERIYGAFGRKAPTASGTRTVKRCLYFKYDPDLFDGVLAVLADGELVQRSWISRGSAKPQECSGLSEETVDLSGWYAARVR